MFLQKPPEFLSMSIIVKAVIEVSESTWPIILFN